MIVPYTYGSVLSLTSCEGGGHGTDTPGEGSRLTFNWFQNSKVLDSASGLFLQGLEMLHGSAWHRPAVNERFGKDIPLVLSCAVLTVRLLEP